MWKFYGSKGKRVSLPIRERVLYIALVMVGFFFIATASLELIAEGQEYTDASSEYEQLREQYPVMSAYLLAARQLPPSQETGDDITVQATALNPEVITNYEDDPPLITDTLDEEQQDPLAGLAEENPDFVGWISIEGVIDYPIVRGRDNNRYLWATFTGQRNGSGAIFMDYRNTRGFSESVCLLYGHNMKNGSMFAPLNRYADPAYIANHPDIIVVTSDGEVLEYRIFAAKRVFDIDEIYDLGYTDAESAAKAFGGAPDGTSNFLLLSTCTPSIEKDDRIIVFAANKQY